MKNITVSVDETVHRRARVRAAERGTSLSAVVRDFLIEYSGGETEFERRRNLQTSALRSVRGFRAVERLTRDEVHGRDEIR